MVWVKIDLDHIFGIILTLSLNAYSSINYLFTCRLIVVEDVYDLYCALLTILHQGSVFYFILSILKTQSLFCILLLS